MRFRVVRGLWLDQGYQRPPIRHQELQLLVDVDLEERFGKENAVGGGRFRPSRLFENHTDLQKQHPARGVRQSRTPVLRPLAACD